MEINNPLEISPNLVYRNNPSGIIILDAHSSVMSIQTMDMLHKSLGLWMYGYHYFIDKNGDVYGGRPERALACNADVLLQSQLTNMTHLNISPFDLKNNADKFESTAPTSVVSAGKIFICLEGITSQSSPPSIQIESLINLCKDINSRYMNMRTIYSLSELLPQYNNLGIFVDMNAIRAVTITNIETKIISCSPIVIRIKEFPRTRTGTIILTY